MNFARKIKNKIKGLIKGEKEYYNLMKFLGIDEKNTKAINEATYFTCQKLLCEAMGKLPCQVLKHNEDGGVTKERKHPAYNVLRMRPNPYMTSTEFWSYMEFNKNHWGNSYALITGAGTKLQLWPLESENVEVIYDDAMKLSDIPDVYYAYTKGGKLYTFKSEQVLHFRTSVSYDGITGLSVREILQETIKGNIKSQRLLNKSYDTSFMNKAAVQYTGNLNDENTKAFLRGIQDYIDNKDEALGNLIPIPLGSKIEALSMKLADNEFLGLKKYSAIQIASAFGIKPNQIGDYEKSSFASAEAQQLSFYVDTLLFNIKNYEEEITYKIISREDIDNGYHVKFNVAVILRADLKTQIETLAKAVSSFLYTPNEARAKLDMCALPGGEKLLGNGASIPVELAGLQYQKSNGKEEE